MIYSLYYLAALATAAADVFGRLARWRIATPLWPAATWAATLFVTYAAQLAILYASAWHRWPIPLVPPEPTHLDAVAASMLALAAIQVIALVGLYRARQDRYVVAGGVAMLLLSLAAPVICSGDLYAYVGNGLLGLHAYAPPATAFTGEFAKINARWGTPVPPATYGPLWLLIAQALVSLAPSLLGKLLALRAFSAACFVATLWLLQRYGLPARLIALAALNPGLLLQLVVDAHNDALPIALAVAAAVCVRRAPLVAVACVALAASVKLPYLLAALPVFATIVPPLKRYAYAFAAVVAALLVACISGPPYFHALISYASGSQAIGVLHVVAALAAAVALVAALARKRRYRGVVWLVPMLGAYTASWYATWSIPYALERRRVLAYLLLWFPFVSVIAEPSLATPWGLFFVLPALIAVALR